MDNLISTESFTPDGLMGFDITTLLIAIVIGGSIFLLLFLLYHYKTNNKNNAISSEAFAIINAKKKAERKNKILASVYHAASNLPITRKYVRTIERAYMNLCPYEDYMLIRLTSETLTITFFISSISVIAILSMNLILEQKFSAYAIACAVLIVYILSVEILSVRVRAKERKLTEEFAFYFATVKHIYLAKRNVPQAIIEAADGMSHEITMHATQIYNILSGTERKGKVREYALDPRTNKYMKLFVGQAYEASERGDTLNEHDDASLFTKNLEFLRMEMMRDAHIKEKKDFKFQGYSFMTCLWVFFMVPLRNWGIDFAADMANFYNSLGYLIMIVSFIVTMLVYDNVNKAKAVDTGNTIKDVDFFDKTASDSIIRKYMNMIEIRHTEGLEKIRKMLRETGSNSTLGAFVVRMTMYTVIGTLLGTTFFAAAHIQSRNHLLSEVNTLDGIVYVTSQNQKDAISQHILDMTREYLNEEITLDELKKDFSNRMHISNKESVENICTEIQQRIASYRNEYLKWYEFALSLLLGVGAGLLPLLSLKYRYNIALAGRNNEIRQFQSIIIMERAFPDITVQQILEEMETFSVIFRNSIRKCLNSYSAGPKEALLELRDNEIDCREFVELIDGFLAVESVGVNKAFAEVYNNREMSENSRIFLEDVLMEKKRDITDMISMIPMAVVIGGYFVVPLCYYTFSSLSGVFDMLETFNGF